MSVLPVSAVIAVVVLTLSAAFPASAKPFNQARGEQWRAQCTAGQSKYTCCKNAERACIDDCGELQQCQNNCSLSYSSCVKGMASRLDDLRPGVAGESVLDPGPSSNAPLGPTNRPGISAPQ